MPFSLTNREGRQVLSLEGRVTVQDAQELAGAVAVWLEDRTPLEVDTRELTDADTCIVQYLCALRKSVSDLSFSEPSEALTMALDRCQLRSYVLGLREGL